LAICLCFGQILLANVQREADDGIIDEPDGKKKDEKLE